MPDTAMGTTLSTPLKLNVLKGFDVFFITAIGIVQQSNPLRREASNSQESRRKLSKEGSAETWQRGGWRGSSKEETAAPPREEIMSVS